MSSRIAVTGAGGFVGGYVARYLADRGFSVTAIARLAPSEPPPDNLTWRLADLLSSDPLPERCDVVIHCAAELPSRTSDPERLYRLNVDMASKVFACARAAGAGTIVFLSSMSVYGRISVPMVDEDLRPDSPDPYGRAKADAEAMLGAMVGDGFFSALSLRLPGTVGRGSHHNFLSDALARALAGETVCMNNPEALFNNIVYVADLAEFLARWAEVPKLGYAVANLAAEEPLPIREVVSLLFSTLGRPERIECASGGKQPFLIALDRAKALGYRPATVRASVEAFARDSRVG